MKTLDKRNKVNRVRAIAGEELGLLVNLLREERIGYRMLLRNVAEIVADDYTLLVPAVLVLTDKKKAKAAGLAQVEFDDALVALRVANDFKGRETLIAAISDTMQADW